MNGEINPGVLCEWTSMSQREDEGVSSELFMRRWLNWYLKYTYMLSEEAYR